jgi:putative membrane protein
MVQPPVPTSDAGTAVRRRSARHRTDGEPGESGDTGRGRGSAASVRGCGTVGTVTPPPSPSLRTLTLPERVDVVALVLGVATVWCYVAGVRRLRHRGRHWPVGRTAAFVSGAAVILLATQTGIARYDTVLFSDHVLQHVMLGMLAPVLLALGAPVTLALQSGGPSTKRLLRQALDTSLARTLTHPVTATVLFGATLFVLYFTPLYELSLRNGVVHAWVHIHFVVVGVLFAEAIVGLDLSRRRTDFPARLGLVMATVPFHAFLGVALLSSTTVLAADWYGGTGRTWGATALADQKTGAGILWAAGELFGLVLAGVVLARWMVHSDREGRRHDRLLDAGMVAR